MADRLERYREKRRAEESPEPQLATSEGGFRFVVQKHAARRMHYDLRLEHDGVLASWAVPQGPCLDPTVKRLAVRTEDHPVDYADFEGVIPEGNYGAGSMIVWDQGRFTPAEDLTEGFRSGKLLFDLFGHKLRGRWTLVRTHRREARTEEWLLIKKPDGWARDGEDFPYPDVSVLSGLSVEELKTRQGRLDEVRTRIEGMSLPEAHPPSLAPMLAQETRPPFTDPGWVFELKYDGFRLVAKKTGSDVRLYYRSGRDATDIFPELTAAVRRIPADRLWLDGEVVVLDDEAIPRFQLLQSRVQTRRAVDIRRASLDRPATLYAFDLPYFEGWDLRERPLVERKSLLAEVVPKLGPVRYTDHVEGRGQDFFRVVAERGLEGLMAKRAASPYRSGRSPDWAKIPARRRDDFVIVGFTAPKRGRVAFGGLHLAQLADHELVYAGRVGSGFDDEMLHRLQDLLLNDRRDSPPVHGAPDDASSTWVEPRHVCEVRFLQRTTEGLLRQPVFLGLRPDKELERKPDYEPPPKPTEEEPKVHLVNLDKVFWPEDGYTKQDLIRYYESVAGALLPLLDDRPVVLTRYPDGIEGKNFFQKNMPEFTPSWIRTVRIWSEHTEREIDYLVLDSVEALLYAANSATIPLHVWASRTASLPQPDWLVLDLDPKQAPFSSVIRLAKAAHRLCEDLALPAFAKTSGSTGLHVLVPLGGQLTYLQARQLAELLARVLVAEHPDIATIDRVIQTRGDRVYIDYLQNGHGRLLVSAFSVRPLPGAPVSAPLHWREVKAGLDPQAFDIENLPRRLSRQRKDPWTGFLDARPDLLSALEELRHRLPD